MLSNKSIYYFILFCDAPPLPLFVHVNSSIFEIELIMYLS